jgi:tetratricopeptide (TPR) repeat protein
MFSNPSATQAPDLHWQFYTKQGNEQMQSGLYAEANKSYLAALELAEIITGNAKRHQAPVEMIHIYVVSCYNLAGSFQKLGSYEEAEQCLLDAYQTTDDIMEDENLLMDARSTGYQGFQASFMQLSDFYGSTGQKEKLVNLIDSSKVKALEFLALVKRNMDCE